MRDYPLLAISQLAKVSNIDFFGSRGLVSLDITGSEFTGTNAVLINGHRSPTFVVISDSRLLADVPQAVQEGPIRTLSVLKSTIGPQTKGSIISFEAISSASEIPSSTFLVQKVLKRLFTTRGSDIFNPASGGDLLSLIGTTDARSGNLGTLARIYIDRAVNQLIEDQAPTSSPLEQKVQSVEVLEATYSKIHTSLDIRLSITSMAGQRVVAGLSV